MDSNNTVNHKADSIEFTRIRTALALDRTLLAWDRTALTLIGFGFTLAKFVHDLIAKGVLHGVQPGYPRQVGFALMGIGVITLFAGAYEYFRLGKGVRKANVFCSASFLVTVSLIVLGLYLIVSLLCELASLGGHF